MTRWQQVFGATHERKRGITVLVIALAALTFAIAGAVADDNPQPVDFTHNGLDAAAPVTGGVFGSGPAHRPGTAACTSAPQSTSGGANVNTDCRF